MQKKQKFTRSEFLFLVAYVLWLSCAVIKLTYLKNLFAYAKVGSFVEKIVLVILLWKLIEDDKYGIREIAGIVVVCALYYVSIRSGAPAIMIPVIFIFSSRNMDYRDFFKVTMIVQLSVMGTSVLCSLCGIIPNEIWEEEGRIRYSLGYTFCTYGSHISFFLTLVYISIKQKYHIMEAAALFVWNYVWYRVTNTRIDIVLCIPVILGSYILGRYDLRLWRHWFCRLALILAGPVLAIIMVAVHWFYRVNRLRWIQLNTLLNGRIFYGHDALHRYPPTLWGQSIKWVGRGGVKLHPDWTYNYVDCSYIKYFINYGLIFFVLLLLGMMLMGKWVTDTHNYSLAVAFLGWLIFGAVDAELFELNFQPFMLLLGYAFAERRIRSHDTETTIWRNNHLS